METINHYFFGALQRFADTPMQVHRSRTWTYSDAARAMHGVALRLQEMGVQPGDRVALIAENSPRWLHVMGGILAAGAVLVPRGEDTADGELAFILEHSGSSVVFTGSERQTERVPEGLETVPMYDDAAFPEPVDLDANTLQDYARRCAPKELAVILYTSGTTGHPKGVMLEQRNIAHNIRTLPDLIDMEHKDVWVSILPPWHTFEMTVELCAFSVGGTTVYSDKRRLRDDLRSHQPHYFASVPRIWETIYNGTLQTLRKRGGLLFAIFKAAHASTGMWRRGNPLGLPLHLLGKKLFYGKIAAATGGRLKCAISGGGYLPPHIDEFFRRIGITLLVGYGLTETAPVVALRRPEVNVLGTIGRAVPETEIRVGPTGTFLVRGPQVMRGYYRSEEGTRAVLDDDGWFDTGDLGRITEDGDLIFVGRLKETIVLSGGENIEPEPVENSILQSPLVAQVMLVGQDRKTLAALVVADPEAGGSREGIEEELRQRSGPSAGFRAIEAINHFALIDEPFTPENGLLTHTLKMRRNEIAERYKDVIESIYAGYG